MSGPIRAIRHAVRKLARTPGFTLVAILTLALGIGANTAIFSIVNGVLLNSLPFAESERLAFLQRPGDNEGDISVLDGQDIRAQTASFEALGLVLPFWAFDLTGSGQPERVIGTVVEPEVFRVLRTPPLVGRPLVDADNVLGAERVAVLSSGFWRSKFAADQEVIGRSITLSDVPYTVVGVMPPEFDVLEVGTDVWVPMAAATEWALSQRGNNNMEAIARLTQDASFTGASAELETVTGRLAAEYPDTNRGKILQAVPLRDRLVGAVRSELLLILAAVGMVLLIACVNLANLFLVRATTREQEIAVRLALGGSRRRVVGAALLESLIVAVVGGSIGVLVAMWGTELLVSSGPEGLPRAAQIGLDARVLMFTAAVSIGTALLFGLAPALLATRRDPADLLGSGTRSSSGRGRQRFLNGFVIAEVALAALLLIGSGLLVRSFMTLSTVETGYETAGVVAANLVLPESRYDDPALQTRAFGSIVEALEADPNVESAAFILGGPLAAFGNIGNSIAFDDRPPPDPSERPGAAIRLVFGDYFGTLSVPMVRGRAFTAQDDEDAPRVAIVNQSFADEYWPGEDPVGKRVAALYTREPEWMTVVGVAADVKHSSLAEDDQTTIYVPYPQRQMPWARFGTLMARGAGGVTPQAKVMQSSVWSVDPALPFDRIETMDRLLADSLAPQRFLTTLLAIFAVVALLISVQGIYGVLAYAVAQRRGEIGIRMALGATSPNVLRMVLRRGALLAAIGLAIGLIAALGLSRLLRGLLFGVATTDVLTYVLVSVVFIATAMIACGLPARRASRVDPIEALRYE